MFKLALKYGALCGVFLIIIFHVSDFFGIQPLMNISHLVFDLIIFGVFIFFGSKDLKSMQQDQVFHFWQGMSIGFLVYTSAALFFALYLLVYFTVQTDALMAYQEAATSFLTERKEVYLEKIGSDTYEKQLLAIQEVSEYDLILSSGLKKLLAGFFITPLISVILRKQPK